MENLLFQVFKSIRARLFLGFLVIIVATLALAALALTWGAPPEEAAVISHRLKAAAIPVAASLALLALGLSVVLTRAILWQVSVVRSAAGQMAAGDLQKRVPQMGGDELGQLGDTINTLADEIQRNLDGIIGEKNKLDAILSSMVDGVVTVAADGNITFYNQIAGRILNDARPNKPSPKTQGKSPSAPPEPPTAGDEPPPLLGRKLADVLYPAPMQELLETCMTSGTLSREMSLEDRAFVVFAVPLGETGHAAEALFLLRDVTSLRQLETARSQFLGNVSHELKTPLTIIKGFVITLLKSPGIIDEWKRYLDFIDRETDRLSRLVDDLLNLARLRSKRTQMNFTFCEPGELLRETYRQLQAQAAKYDSTLVLDCPANLPVLLADPDRFKEIIINLVDNAFKYTPPKGRVELSAVSTAEYLHVRVSDHGPGIGQEEIPFLFERFFRGTDKAGRKSGGTGIGLAIVKEIVDAHRGRISVNSASGEGTTFDVALPLRQKGRRAEESTASGHPPLTMPSPPI